MTFTSYLLLIVGIIAAVVALGLLIRGLRRDNYSRRMVERAKQFEPLTYSESRGRRCALCQ